MRKSTQKPAREVVNVNPVTPVCLQRVRGGATAIEYGLIAAQDDEIPPLRIPTIHA
jgi:hypothetical protein